MISLIFLGFTGKGARVKEAFKFVFGEYGCYSSLASGYRKHVPCEIAANLTRGDAEDKARILREAGIIIDIIPTAEVIDVKHRAFECWSTHRASNGDCFTERGGIVVRDVSLQLNDELAQWQDRDDSSEPWQFELGYNHDHPTNTLDRHGLRMARECGAELGAALTECFPDRKFLIDYRSEQVSFCQFTEDLPVGISPDERSRASAMDSPTDFCEVCECHTPYVVRPEPDPVFPVAQFADCTICGNEMILYADHEVVLASDAACRTYPVPEIPIDAWEHDPFEANLPISFDQLKTEVGNRIHPTREWCRAATRLWLGCELTDMERDQPLIARTLLQIEELTALILSYRIRQLSLSREEQDHTTITPQSLGVRRSSILYHPVRRALAPVTVATRVEETMTSHVLINGTDERYVAGGLRDAKRRAYDCRFEYGIADTKRQGFWSLGWDGNQHRIGNDIAPHGANPWMARPYEVGVSLKRIYEFGAERCFAVTVLYDEQQHVLAQHRRLFRRFYKMDIEPNPIIDMDLSDGMLTLRSDVFVWGVLLGWHGAEKLPDNVFDLFPGTPYSIPWDEAVLGAPKIRWTGNSLLPHSTIVINTL